jgi:hypothetical protein
MFVGRFNQFNCLQSAYAMNHGNRGETPKTSAERPPKIIFGLMSAVASPAIVDQLASALNPHLVVIHHDFSQQPDFSIKATNTCYVPDPKRTGYGVFAFTEGIIHLLKYCVENIEFDYFELMSPVCLPIKPLSQFERYIAQSSVDAHTEFVDPLADRDVMMSFGQRMYAADKTLRHSLLIRARRWYFGMDASSEDIAGVQIARGPRQLWRHPGALLGYSIMRLAQLGFFGRYVPEPGLRPLIGSAWIGATRPVVEYLVRRLTEPALYDHYRRFRDIAEISIPTLLGNSSFRLGPRNTFVNFYEGWSPRVLGVEDLDRLEHTPHFFARKFPDDPNAPVRLRVLERIQETTPPA